jgi:purine-binding chemotaxis protein CheW
MRVPETAVSQPPKYVSGLAAEFIRGIVRLEARLVVLLDLDRILSSQERMQLVFSGLAGGGDPEPATAGKKGTAR